MYAHQAKIDEHCRTIETMTAKLQSKDQEIQEIAGQRDRLKSLRAGILDEVSDLNKRVNHTREKLLLTSQELQQVRHQREEERKGFEGQKKWLESVKNDAEMALQRQMRALAAAEGKIIKLEAEMSANNHARSVLSYSSQARN